MKQSTIKAFLFCGILASLWYVIANVYVPTRYEGYSLSSLTVSELSAIGAPTRQLWIRLVLLYPVFLAMFGWGVLKSVGAGRAKRVVGWLLLIYSVFTFYWPPMHQRGMQPTLTDDLHLAWASVTVVLMIAMMVIGSTLFGRGFRIYTILSIAVNFVFGILTGTEAPKVPLNEPTPWIGVWERINIGVFMLWIIVLAINLLRRQDKVKVEINRVPFPQSQALTE